MSVNLSGIIGAYQSASSATRVDGLRQEKRSVGEASAKASIGSGEKTDSITLSSEFASHKGLDKITKGIMQEIKALDSASIPNDILDAAKNNEYFVPAEDVADAILARVFGPTQELNQ